MGFSRRWVVIKVEMIEVILFATQFIYVEEATKKNIWELTDLISV